MKRWPLLLALAAGACAGPRPQPPQAAGITAPAGWRDGNPTATEQVDPQWWASFGDPVLSDIVRQALANNTDVATAAVRVEEARARLRLATAQQLPNVSLAGGGVRERYVNPFGQAVEAWAGQGQASVAYDLDLFGRLRTASAAARAALLASEDARESVRLAVAASAASGYIQLRALDARLAVLKATLAAREDALRLARRRSDAGYSTALELRQAEAQRDETAQLIPATELAIRQQEDGLSLLLGTTPGAIPRGAPLESLALPGPAPMLPATLLRRRPDIAAAEQQLVAADRSLDSARAAFLPGVRLNGDGGYVASSLLLNNPIAVFSLGGSVFQQLFDGGRLRAQQRGAAAQRDEAAFAYRAAALRAFREVEDALAAIDKTQSQEALLLRERTSTQALLTLATKRYREGYAPYLDQIDAERTLLGTDLSVVQLRAQRLTAAVSLYQALGGGWSEQTTAPPR
ncbi:efflux transporter outer membrane subunit [Sphingomonas azotifigens]|uniref:efflux transporter outer membrane subunit n=1 Tax=Sphingomonas azotifigens TaxID=330920 RepID=UPI0009FF7067|nr:efflux transporter outer membrane subunit [Sphingomonas azotifigens]